MDWGDHLRDLVAFGGAADFMHSSVFEVGLFDPIQFVLLARVCAVADGERFQHVLPVYRFRSNGDRGEGCESADDQVRVQLASSGHGVHLRGAAVLQGAR